MNTQFFIAATLGLLCLSACGPNGGLEFSGSQVKLKDAIFLSETQTLDLDQDGEADDSITSVSLLISEKKEHGKQEDLCKVVSQINAAHGDPAAAADGTNLFFIQASQQHLNQTKVPFNEEESLSGEVLLDANGLPIDNAVRVSTAIKTNAGFFNIFSEGFGTLNLEKLSDDSLDANFLDAPSILIAETGVNDTLEISTENFSLDGSVKRAQLCPALSTFAPQFIAPP